MTLAQHFPETRRAVARLKAAWRDWRLARTVERDRRRWRAALIGAVHEAASEGLFASSSRSDGLRVIKTFEKINRCTFDPNNDYHLQLVTNMGWWFALNRKLNALASSTGHQIRGRAASGMEARSGETACGLDPKDGSPTRRGTPQTARKGSPND